MGMPERPAGDAWKEDYQIGASSVPSAVAPGYNEARKTLACIGPLLLDSLKAWQITGAAWMFRQEEGSIQGGILADARGLGKTGTALATIVARSYAPSGPYRPTLVLASATVLDVWAEEIKDRFAEVLTYHIFYGTRRRKGPNIENKAGLLEILQSLSSTDQASARVLVLSTYSTWRRRMVGGKDFDRRVSRQTIANLQPQLIGVPPGSEEGERRSNGG
ncbi:hypothetical protein BDV59DRAFT_85503 [Aspergillus ambiguus]|uniref:uncharacterized protein n=1 Tax=Aspergillus ambiguus TaxID=176160 RepID=UPI003CCD50C5